MSKLSVALTATDPHPPTSPPDEVALKLRGFARILTAASVATHKEMSPSDVFDHAATYFVAQTLLDLAQDLDGMNAAEA